jgi:hypothetical protein
MLKSVKRYTGSLGANETKAVTIDAVDPSKSFLTQNWGSEVALYARITDATTVTVRNGAGGLNYDFEVVEFE